MESRTKNRLLCCGAFKAQRGAEQNPSDLLFVAINILKGGVAMVKNVLTKAGISFDTALVILGWISFLVSFLINDPAWVISLQMIARVLP